MAARLWLNGTPTSLALVTDRQGGYIMGVRNTGTEETSTGFYLRNAFGKIESGSTAASSMETHTGLGFAGAGTPTSAGGGYVYLRSRWYDPQTGRFLSQDPIGLAGGVNLYAYAGNNPASYSDPFGLRVCFRGNTSAENAKLKEAAEQATDTKIQVDSRNCVKKVTFQGKSNEALAVLADYFMNLVKSDDLYTVKFTPEADSPQWNPRVINIAYTAEGLAYATKVNGKCLDDQFAHSLPQVFAHELFHHRTVPFTGKMDNNENNSVAAENVYNDFAGRPRRCKY